MSNIFKIDWFNRDANYTRINDTFKLNWEEGLRNKYSKFLYPASKVNALLHSNVELINELTTLKDSLGVANNVTISIDNHAETAMTDGRSILLTKAFSEPFDDNYDELDLIIGLLCHEASHCLYTDFEYMQRESKKTTVNPLIHWLHNVIEDEMIETKLGMKYPGYVNFIAKVKYYYFDKIGKKIITEDCVNELDEIQKLFLYTVRYPKYLETVDPSILAKYDDLFLKIKSIMGSNSCLSPRLPGKITHLSMLAAREIYSLLEEYIKNNDEYVDPGKNKGDGDGDGDGNCGGDGDGNCGGDGDGTSGDNKSGTSGKGSIKKTIESEMTECSESPTSVINVTAEVNAKCSAESESNRDNAYRRILNEKRKTCATELNREIEATIFDPGTAASDTIGDGNNNGANITSYNKMLMSVKPYIGLAKQLIIQNAYKDNLQTERFRRNGSLDTSKLADAMMGINTIYNQKMMKKTKNQDAKYALVVMLDESSSMMYQGIFDLSGKLAILLTEVCRDYPEMEIYVYGHGDVVVPYITKNQRNRFVLGKRKMQGNQNEEISYQKIIDDVKSQTNLPIVAINITDSCYLADITAMKSVIDNYTAKHVSFNLMYLNPSEQRRPEIEYNNAIYGEGNWVKCSALDNTFKFAIKTFANIIKKNFDKIK